VNKNSCILVLVILLMSAGVRAQIDSIKNQLPRDTVARLINKPIVQKAVEQLPDTFSTKAFKPDPFKVVWMAAILPGAGQIMNRKYWKLPIVYGGFLGCAYAISWNSKNYTSYRTAYLDIIRYRTDPSFAAIVDKDHSKVSFYQILPKGYDIPAYGGFSGYETKLKTAQDGFRRYRDLSIIISIAYYAMTIVDAYVDAQLYDFDISPGLSMRIQPALLANSYGVNNTLGLQCCFSLR